MSLDFKSELLISAVDLKKIYSSNGNQVEALRGVTLEFRSGEFAAIMGPSGSGKSTLLHCLGGLDRPSQGSVRIGNQPIEKFSDAELSQFRRTSLGFVFQFFNLIPTLTAVENVMLPLLLEGRKKRVVEERALDLLNTVGLPKRAHHHPHELSGGEMQRVAIARAFVARPKLVLADEPTGNLDSKTGRAILELLQRLVAGEHTSVVMVTHDTQAAAFGNRLIRMRDGLLESDSRVEKVSGHNAEAT